MLPDGTKARLQNKVMLVMLFLAENGRNRGDRGDLLPKRCYS
jgi:hypothetical protein